MMKYLPSTLVFLVLCAGCYRNGPLEYQGKTLRYWEAEAASSDVHRRQAAAEALSKIGPNGLRSLVILLNDRNSQVQVAATMGVLKMGAAAVPRLKQLLSDPDAKTRAAAAKPLAQILIDAGPSSVPQLIELLKNPEPNARLHATKALMLVESRAARAAVPAVRELLGDENPAVRRAARSTLRSLEPSGPTKYLQPRNAAPER